MNIQELQQIGQMLEAKIEVVAERAADKAVEKAEKRTQELIRIHYDTCPGARLAKTAGRLVWLMVGSLVAAAINIASTLWRP